MSSSFTFRASCRANHLRGGGSTGARCRLLCVGPRVDLLVPAAEALLVSKDLDFGRSDSRHLSRNSAGIVPTQASSRFDTARISLRCAWGERGGESETEEHRGRVGFPVAAGGS